MNRRTNGTSIITVPFQSAALPSPALSFIGRKNSGKTTLLEKTIAELTRRGLKVATIKHHGHPDFDIDVPGRDSYRHRAAGSRSTNILSDVRFAQVTELDDPLSCENVLTGLSSYDVVLVEGFKQAQIPCVELFRAGNHRDEEAARDIATYWERLIKGISPKADQGTGRTQTLPAAVVSDMENVQKAASAFDIPLFGFEDIHQIATFVQDLYARPKLTIAVQAGGESSRMKRPKEIEPLANKPLISYVLERVSPLADELIVTTNHPERLQFLYDDYPDLIFAMDSIPQRGAIPGFYTALSAAHNDKVGIVACDMVSFPTILLAHEALLLRDCINPAFDAIIPKTDIWYEPFAGVYRKSSCLKSVKSMIEQGHENGRVGDMIRSLHCGFIDCSSPEKTARFGGSFRNVNTPQDLEDAERAIIGDPTCLY